MQLTKDNVIEALRDYAHDLRNPIANPKLKLDYTRFIYNPDIKQQVNVPLDLLLIRLANTLEVIEINELKFNCLVAGLRELGYEGLYERIMKEELPKL